MNYSDMIRVSSGLLQFGIACYALRLGCRFNATRVGWLLFSGLSLLALVYVLLPLTPLGGSIQMAVKADVIYGLISILVLAGLVNMDVQSRKRMLAEAPFVPSAEPVIETVVQTDPQLVLKIDELSKANEELQQTASKLQIEIARRLESEERAVKGREESHNRAVELAGLNEGLRQTISALEGAIGDERRMRHEAEQHHGNSIASANNEAAKQLSDATSRILQDLRRILSAIESAQSASVRLAGTCIAPVVRLSAVRNVRPVVQTIAATASKPTANGRKASSKAGRKVASKSRKTKSKSTEPAQVWQPAPAQPRPVPNQLARFARNGASGQAVLARKLEVVRQGVAQAITSLSPAKPAPELPRLVDLNAVPGYHDTELTDTQLTPTPALDRLVSSTTQTGTQPVDSLSALEARADARPDLVQANTSAPQPPPNVKLRMLSS